ncbi:MAG TPA: DUF58 domain-containing protein, partial [Pirellulales bacterium]|nr:DUF58 domain-containing protein [Pirellulales bacterium]
MSSGEPTKLHYAKQVAAALGFIGLTRADRVKIETLGQPAHRPGPALRGRHSLWRMLEQLANIEAGENVPLAQGVKNFCLRNSSSGLVVLISDLLDKAGYEEALRYLLARQMDIYVVHVLSQEELHPELQGDLRLVDCEDKSVAEITVSGPLLERYQRTLAAFVSGAKDFCTRRGIGYLLADTQLGVDRLVGGYLRERGLIR